MPVFNEVIKQEPESYPFRQPVNPIDLGIPDYFDVIKNPIDLSTIRKKLESGSYSDPWQFCDDMQLMFNNAWTFNKKTSRVYKFCSKLHEVFYENIDKAMVSLGYCCGQKYFFHTQVLYCDGKLCLIPRDSVYYNYKDM
uniref:Bromo domain-containing protein n=1 Tax=Amphimedon queenslandica TaxID=400682 RepID=A0A1X7SMB3_AMPQE